MKTGGDNWAPGQRKMALYCLTHKGSAGDTGKRWGGQGLGAAGDLSPFLGS